MNTIIFEGGGVKLISVIGVVQALEEAGLYPDLKIFYGTSAGSISAVLCALNYTYNELMEDLYKTDFTKFKQTGWFGPISGMISLYKDYGYYYTEYLENWIENLIEKKTGNKNITFREFHENFDKELIMFSTNTNTEETVRFDKENFPDMPIALACRASASIPFFFRPTLINGDLYVDGGILDNYGIADCKDVTKSIGIRFSNDGLSTTHRGHSNILDFGICIFQSMLRKIGLDGMSNVCWDHTITIQTDVSSTNFDLTNDDKNGLINAGYSAVHDYFG